MHLQDHNYLKNVLPTFKNYWIPLQVFTSIHWNASNSGCERERVSSCIQTSYILNLLRNYQSALGVGSVCNTEEG